TVYFVTDEGDDIHYLARYDVPTRTVAQLVRLEGQDMIHLEAHREGNALYILAMQGDADRLYRYDLDTGRLDEIPLPYDTVEGLHVAKSGTLYVLGRSSDVPFNISRLVPGGDWER